MLKKVYTSYTSNNFNFYYTALRMDHLSFLWLVIQVFRFIHGSLTDITNGPRRQFGLPAWILETGLANTRHTHPLNVALVTQKPTKHCVRMIRVLTDYSFLLLTRYNPWLDYTSLAIVMPMTRSSWYNPFPPAIHRHHHPREGAMIWWTIRNHQQATNQDVDPRPVWMWIRQ